MEKKLKIIDYELEQTEKRLENLLAGIKQLKKEVRDMLPPESKKVMYERVVINRKDLYDDDFINLRKFLHLSSLNYKIINIVRYTSKVNVKYTFYNSERIMLSNNTNKKQVIITYIPKDNLIIVVER